MRLISLVLLACAFAVAQAPRILSKTEPEYTEEARRAAVNASVTVGLTVATDGLPVDVHIVRGAGFGLDEAAIEAVRAWRFNPGMKQGVAVNTKTTIDIDFRQLAQGHEGQKARLVFDDSRPQLAQGRVPMNPDGAGEARVRIALTAGSDGNVRDASILETTSQPWAEQVLNEVNGWKFQPGPMDSRGIFELTTGLEASRDRLVSLNSSDVQDPALPAPQLLLPEDKAEFNVFPRHTSFRWEPVPGAVSYILESDYGSKGTWHAEEQKMPGTGYAVAGTEFAFDFVGAQPGRWRVWPVNAMGQRGQPSEWRTFRYLR